MANAAMAAKCCNKMGFAVATAGGESELPSEQTCLNLKSFIKLSLVSSKLKVFLASEIKLMKMVE